MQTLILVRQIRVRTEVSVWTFMMVQEVVTSATVLGVTMDRTARKVEYFLRTLCDVLEVRL